ncbi:MAG: DNA-processing protein DprA [Hyphomicrobium sp.]
MPNRKPPTLAEPGLFQPAPLPVAKLDCGERLACLRLIRSDNVGPVAFRQLINHYGGATNALQALPEIARRGGRGKPIRICPAHQAEAELDAARRCGAEPVFTIEPHYPAALAVLAAPPPRLYIKGRPELLNRPAIAIVGSRESSAAGIKIARMFARGLGDAGYVIVSGLARGIDGAAHDTALATGTVAVLAGGLDIVYPPEHKALQERIALEGCLVSEQPPGFSPRGQDFPRRNRIISGIALAVVIVEAAARSGTLVTARYALEQGREVFSVPGHPLDPRAEGTNRLIKQGATLVTEANDILVALAPISGLSETAGRPPYPLAVPQTAAPVSSPPPDVGDSVRQGVLSVLGPAPVNFDAITGATGLTARLVQVALMELELAGRIARPGPGLIALKADEM